MAGQSTFPACEMLWRKRRAILNAEMAGDPAVPRRIDRQVAVATVGLPDRGAQFQIFLAAAQRAVVGDEEGLRVGAARFADNELVLVACEGDAVGFVNAAS